MANVQDFQQWFTSHYCDKEGFAKSSREFQCVQDATRGWAANGLMYILNAASSFLDDDEEYLEIGTYGGRSLIAALRDNDRRAQVIDPFVNTAPQVRVGWEQAIDQFGMRDRVTLHEAFAEQFSDDLPKIGLFFYDGNHDSGHTYEGLKRFEPFLSDKAIIIVDDYMITATPIQDTFPGHHAQPYPVQSDTDRWLRENQQTAKLLTVTPWTFQQAIICYERN